uniref:Putative secreted protein n=1 Tax=Ixodes ricinus TaxID=34613 RepID=A0A6B0U0E1_IXORI
MGGGCWRKAEGWGRSARALLLPGCCICCTAAARDGGRAASAMSLWCHSVFCFSKNSGLKVWSSSCSSGSF